MNSLQLRADVLKAYAASDSEAVELLAYNKVDSMGACTVDGHNNWDRVCQYRQQWTAQNPQQCPDTDWAVSIR